MTSELTLSNGGRSASAIGKVTGSLPDGLTSPNSTSAIAVPPRSPGYQAISTPATSPTHGIVMALPPSRTTIVREFSAPTAATTPS